MEQREACVTCGAPLDGLNQATCFLCGGKFHQPWSIRIDVPHCGRIVSHQEAMALMFMCQHCYEHHQEGGL